MTRPLAVILFFTASLPITVEVPRDTSYAHPPSDRPGLRLMAAGGEGAYDAVELLSGCGSTQTVGTHVTHSGAGGQAEYEFPSGGYVLGVRGGAIEHTRGDVYTDYVPAGIGRETTQFNYWNPYFSIEKYAVGIGGGPVISRTDFAPSGGPELGPASFSGHARLGPRGGPYMALQYMEAVPLLAGGQYGDVALAVPLWSRGEIAGGFGIWGQSDRLQTWNLRARLQIVPALAVFGGGYWGSSSASAGGEGGTSGWHVGLEWRSTPAPRDTAPAVR